MRKDFLDEIIAERSRDNPDFPRLVDEAVARRELARKLAALRERVGLTQTTVADRMGTSQSVVSKLERGADVRISTLQRYCAVIGQPFLMAPARRHKQQSLTPISRQRPRAKVARGASHR